MLKALKTLFTLFSWGCTVYMIFTYPLPIMACAVVFGVVRYVDSLTNQQKSPDKELNPPQQAN
jgi:hypothetical protein